MFLSIGSSWIIDKAVHVSAVYLSEVTTDINVSTQYEVILYEEIYILYFFAEQYNKGFTNFHNYCSF